MGLTTKEFADRPTLKWVLITASALVVLVMLMLIAKGCGATDAPSSTTNGAATSTVPATGKGSVLPQRPELQRAPTDPDWLTAPPHAISWQRVDGIPFPFSDSDGPQTIHGAVATGYSHTPQGAVLAAAHISFRLAWSPDYQAVLDAQTRISASARAALIDGRSHSGSIDPAMVAVVAKAPVAFKVVDYTPSKAVVFLAFPTPSNVYRIAPVAVVWADNDWRYSDALDPQETKNLADTDDLAGSGFTSLEEEK